MSTTVYVDYLEIGVTGTRRGMTRHQALTLTPLIKRLKIHHGAKRLHHGDCVGVDVEMANMAEFFKLDTVAHPPSAPQFRAYHKSTFVLPPAAYMARNGTIVESTGILIGVPSGAENVETRSGTWETIRMARRLNKPRIVVMPNGHITEVQNFQET